MVNAPDGTATDTRRGQWPDHLASPHVLSEGAPVDALVHACNMSPHVNGSNGPGSCKRALLNNVKVTDGTATVLDGRCPWPDHDGRCPWPDHHTPEAIQWIVDDISSVNAPDGAESYEKDVNLNDNQHNESALPGVASLDYKLCANPLRGPISGDASINAMGVTNEKITPAARLATPEFVCARRPRGLDQCLSLSSRPSLSRTSSQNPISERGILRD